jgi:myo-inositol-1(or 4)-monophosphatase
VNTPDPDEIRELARSLAIGAGDILTGMSAGRTESKTSPTDLVTEADRAAESYIFRRLRDARPEDSILAEEGSGHSGSTGITWIIDPLDGTINYIYGIPQWCVSIGVEGAVRLGVIHDPSRGETFSDTDRLAPSTKTRLADCLLATGFSYSAETRAKQSRILTSVLPKVRDIRRAGSCALDLAWVASGRVDGFYEEDTHAWDISAGIAIIEGVGGAVSTHGSLTIAAGNAELLASLEEVVLEASQRDTL